MICRRLVDRSRELGALGHALTKLVPLSVSRSWPSGLVNQSVRVRQMAVQGHSKMAQVAATLLLCDAMVQLRVENDTIRKLAELAVEPLSLPTPPRIRLGKNKSGIGTFVSKAASAAQRKANLRFGDVYRDTLEREPEIAARISELSGHMVGLTDDQATAAVVLAVALKDKMPDPAGMAIRALLDPSGAKVLSTTLKSLGANNTMLGACLCEMNCLQGRGVGQLNLADEVAKRVGDTGRDAPLPHIGDEELRKAVRKVLEREIGDQEVEYQSMDDFWGTRWLWCVNGSHSRVMEEDYPDLKVEMRGQVHRRVAMEEWSENPMNLWKGDCHVTASEKHEHGKTRLILSCDTLNYLAFEHFLRPIEKVWKNHKVLLNPGDLGHHGVAERVVRLGSENTAWLMLDYDDFNSQHSLRAQAIVIEEAAKYVGYEAGRAEKLVNSFWKMRAYAGNCIGEITTSLMSGHRGTTFLNSVLNEAYIRVAVGDIIDKIPRLHTGDDVVMAVGSLDTASMVLEACEARQLRMNPLKQSVGTVGAEFLRMAITRKRAIGYVSRSIASTVSGNWVNPKSLDGLEHIRTMISNAHTIRMRSGVNNISDIMVTSFLRKLSSCPIKVAEELLRGVLAIDGGPMFSMGRSYRSCSVDVSFGSIAYVDLVNVKRNATREYMTQHVSEVESYTLAESGLSPIEQMLDASYGKTLTERGDVEHRCFTRFRRHKPRAARGYEVDRWVWRSGGKTGLLSGYPLIHLVKNQIPNRVLRDVLLWCGWDGRGSMREAAWGSQADGAIIEGCLSYSDAAHICSLAEVGVVGVTREIRV